MSDDYYVMLPDAASDYYVMLPDADSDYYIRTPGLCEAPNVIPNPSDFTLWTPVGSVVVTGDVLTAPDDTLTADRVDFVDLASTLLISSSYPVQIGPQDVSFWLKRESVSTGNVLQLFNSTTANGEWTIDLFNSAFDGDVWVLVDKNHPAVTVVNPMQSSSSFMQVYFENVVNTATIGLWCFRIWESS